MGQVSQTTLLLALLPTGISMVLCALWFGARQPYARISMPVDAVYATVLLNIALVCWFGWALFT